MRCFCQTVKPSGCRMGNTRTVDCCTQNTQYSLGGFTHSSEPCCLSGSRSVEVSCQAGHSLASSLYNSRCDVFRQHEHESRPNAAFYGHKGFISAESCRSGLQDASGLAVISFQVSLVVHEDNASLWWPLWCVRDRAKVSHALKQALVHSIFGDC